MVVPGICGRIILETNSVNSIDDQVDAQQVLNDTDRIYAYLIKTIVPVGFRGLVLAGLLSALMSVLASVFNSTSTIFALNVWKCFQPSVTEYTLVWVGRVVVVIVAILAMLWLPIMQMMSTHLFLMIQAPRLFNPSNYFYCIVWSFR